MGRVRVRYLVERKRRSKTAYYWSPKASLLEAGFEVQRLSDDKAEAVKQAEAFNSKLDRWYAGEPLEETGPAPWTLAALDDLFQTDRTFEKLAPRTQRDYCYCIKPAIAWAGDMPARGIGRVEIMGWLREQIEERGEANTRNAGAALRRLLAFGCDQGWLETNPAASTDLPTPAKRVRVWSVEERDQFCLTAIDQGTPSMALAVMLGWCIGQRPADLRNLTWASYDGQAIALRQAKTKADIRVPCLPELRALLDNVTRTHAVMVVSEATQKPYLESAFQHLFARIRAKAGLPDDLQFRDLRRTLATALGAAGCTVMEIQAITGHKTLEILTTYTVSDDRFAQAAMGKLQRSLAAPS